MKCVASAGFFTCLRRYLHTTSTQSYMRAWQVYKYGSPENLELNNSVRLPIIEKPNDVLIKVNAASVNPLDVRMLDGYGERIINVLRCFDRFPETRNEFPLTLGRDFSGIILDCGKQVKAFKAGDKVWGALGVGRQGCHAEYVVASSCSVNEISSSTAYFISKKPESLSDEDAASLPYVALTAQSTWVTAGRFLHPPRNLRALVLGGSGGVGSFAVQYMKCLGLEVTTTCSGDAQDFVGDLGADFIVDYTKDGFKQRLTELGQFDFILDAAGIGPDSFYVNLLKANGCSKFVTLSSPVLSDTDRFGLLAGTSISTLKASMNTLTGLCQGKHIRWAFFVPNGKFLEELAGLVDAKKVRPIVDRRFAFENTQEAFSYMRQGHARGKTVINMVKEPSSETA